MPSPVVLPAKYIIKTDETEESSGLGLTISLSSVTFTGIEVGRPLTITTYVNVSGMQTHTVSGATLIAQVTKSNSSYTPLSVYVGTATASSVRVAFNQNIGSAKYLFSAYQA